MGGPIVAIGTIVLAFCLQNGQWVCFKPKNAAQDQPVNNSTVVVPVQATYGPNGSISTANCNGTSTDYATAQGYVISCWTYYQQSGGGSTAGASWITGEQCNPAYAHAAQPLLACYGFPGAWGGLWDKGGICTQGTPNGNGGCVINSNTYSSDNSPTLRSTGGGQQTWTSDAADPDPAPSPMPQPMTATGTDPDGAPASTTITPQADGVFRCSIPSNTTAAGILTPRTIKSR